MISQAFFLFSIFDYCTLTSLAFFILIFIAITLFSFKKVVAQVTKADSAPVIPESSKKETNYKLGKKETHHHWCEAELNEYPPTNVPYYITHEGISCIDNDNTFTLKFNVNPLYDGTDDFNSSSSSIQQEAILCNWKAVSNTITQEQNTISYNFDSEKDNLTISMPEIHTHWSVDVSLTCNLSPSVNLNFVLMVEDGKVIFVEGKITHVLRHTPSMILMRE